MGSVGSVHGTSVQNITEYKELPFSRQSYVDSISSLKLSQQAAKPEESCLRKFWNAIVTFFNWIYCCSCCYYKKEDGSTTTDTAQTSSSTTPVSSKDVVTTDSADDTSSSEGMKSPGKTKESKKGNDHPLDEVVRIVSDFHSKRCKEDDVIHCFLRIKHGEKDQVNGFKKTKNIDSLIKKAITSESKSEISLIVIFRNRTERGSGHVCKVRDFVIIDEWTFGMVMDKDFKMKMEISRTKGYDFNLIDDARAKENLAAKLSKLKIKESAEIAKKLTDKVNKEHQSIKKKSKG